MASDFLEKVGGGNFLRAALGGRECTSGFFNDQGQTLDVSTVCHEVRSLDLKDGEQAYVSVRDLRRREGEAFAQMGMVCNLRALELDTTLLLRVWVDEAAGAGGKPASGERRVLGEVRLPLRRLIQSYNAALYHTWITLESPGLHDSVASLGFISSDDGATFDQAIQDGPKQLSQPKACISICRSSDVGSTGKILWAADIAPELRAAGWGPLLRSQQQHIVLGAALHLKCERQASQLSSASAESSSKQSSELQDRVRGQAEEIERLREEIDRLHSAHSQLQQQSGYPQQQNIFSTNPNLADLPQRPESPPRGREGLGGLSITQAPGQGRPAGLGQDAQAQAQSRRLADTEARLADAEAREHRATEQLRDTIAEADSLRRECDQQREEAHNVQMELDKISTEANGKIEAANDRIRTLRSRRDEAEQELQTLKASTLPLYQEEKNKMEAENRQLSEQKEALLRIVEDLHQTCIAAGLNTAGRQSIDNITCTITQDFRLS